MELLPLYKGEPPFMNYTKGFGYLGVILQDKTTGKIQCHLCGKLFKSVSKHIWHKHEINDFEYKLDVGLNNTTPLVCESTSKKHRDYYLENKKVIERTLRKNNKIIYEKKLIKVRQNIGRKCRVQQKNLFGTCDLQAKEMFWAEFRKLGKIPTTDEMTGSLKHIVFTRFQTYNEALKTWGVTEENIKKYKEENNKKIYEIRKSKNFFPKYDKQIIIEQNINFHKTHGRLPTWEEGRRIGFPSREVYLRCFGTKRKKELEKILLKS